MKKEFKLLRFKDVSLVSQKARRFRVYSAHSEDLIGFIHWGNDWRCYVMSYVNDIDMSLSCEKELVRFMEDLK